MNFFDLIQMWQEEPKLFLSILQSQGITFKEYLESNGMSFTFLDNAFYFYISPEGVFDEYEDREEQFPKGSIRMVWTRDLKIAELFSVHTILYNGFDTVHSEKFTVIHTLKRNPERIESEPLTDEDLNMLKEQVYKEKYTCAPVYTCKFRPLFFIEIVFKGYTFKKGNYFYSYHYLEFHTQNGKEIQGVFRQLDIGPF